MAGAKGQIVSKSELLDILGTTHPTVDAWMAKGMPVERHGSGGNEYQYNTMACIRWLCTMAAESGIVPGSGAKAPIRQGAPAGVESEAEAERRLAIAKANKAEAEYTEMRGGMVPVAEAVAAVENEYANIRAKLLALPAKLAAKVAACRKPAEARALLDTEIRALLQALAYDPAAGSGGHGAGNA